MKLKIYSIILTIISLLVLTAMSACGEDSGEITYGIVRNGNNIKIVLPNLEAPTELKVIPMSGDQLSEYSIVRSDTAKQLVTDASLLMKDAISALGVNPKLATDWVKKGDSPPSDTKEILIGSTNRAENPEYRSLRAGDYLIKYENSRLVICGGSDEATAAAAKCFTEYFIDSNTGELLIPDGGEYLYRAPVPARSFLLNGVQLYDYQVVFDQVDEKTAINVKKFILDVTGLNPLEESEYKIVIGAGTATDTCTVTADGKTVYIGGNGVMDPIFAARCFTSYIFEAAGLSADKTELSADITIDSVSITKEDYPLKSEIFLYVSPNGNDDNIGSEAMPLATLDGARIRVRELMQTTSAPIRVIFSGGEYYFTKNIEFLSEDSGHELAPVTYEAKDGEKVTFVGGIKVDPSRIKKAENSDITDRVLDPDAAEGLMQIDLSGLIESYQAFYSAGNPDYWSIRPTTVYINGNPLEYSRYPNDSSDNKFLTSANRVDKNNDGSKSIYMDEETIDHVNSWSDEALENLYLLGYLAYEWVNETYTVTSLDKKTGAITLPGGLTEAYWDSIAGGKRYCFLNIPEEIDVPGESYIDRENLIVYFLPEEDFDADKVYVSTLIENLITLDGTSNLTFDGIDVMYSRGAAFSAENVYNITVTNSTMAHLSAQAASFNGTRITFTGNHIYDTATGGVYMSGGDRKTLTSGESIIENCLIHDINRNKETYKPGIDASSLGLIVRNNTLYNCVHEMIKIGSNDVVIEYNRILNTVQESADMGAIYQGRNPSQMGTVIRYNYFEAVGDKYGAGSGQHSIYLDDGHNGAEIYGNIFINGSYDGSVIFTNGAQFSRMTNNIFISAPYAFQSSIYWDDDQGNDIRWFMWIYDRVNGGENEILKKFTSVEFDSEIWREHYKGTIWEQTYDYIDSERIEKYAALTDDEMSALAIENAPYQTNVFTGNVLVNIGDGTELPYYGLNCFYENNCIFRTTDIFKNYGTDFTLTAEALAEIRKIIPNFEELPLDLMGAEG